MMTGLMQDQNLEKQIEKQIGCMSGFLHIFDRQQILAGKRIYATKRLPPSTGVTSSPESVKSVQTTPKREIVKPAAMAEPVVAIPESPDRFQSSPAANSNNFPTVTPPKSPLPLPIFDLKEGTMKTSWKFCKEMPRLSLDSRATVDSKGSLCPREIRRDNGANSVDESFDKQRRSPSVIARLMGLEQLPSSDSSPSPETVKKPELRRSASESRVSRDLFHSRFVDGANFHVKQTNQTTNQSAETNLTNNGVRDNVGNLSNRTSQNGRVIESMKYTSRNLKTESPRSSPWRSPQQRRSFFDSADIFPEPKQITVPTYSDSEKNLKFREIDEQSKDLETLKHILEALQLKGLLHSRRPPNIDSQHNFVYDPSFPSDDPNIVLMKPVRSPAPNRRCRNDYGGVNRYAGENLPSVSPKKERGVLDRSGRSPVRARNSMATNNSKNCNTIVKRKPLCIETQRSFHESSDSRRSSPINSPKLTPRRSGSDHQYIPNRSPRSRRPADVYSKEKVSRNLVMEDESSYFSESSGSTNSQSDPERSKMEEYREGKSLLDRCDKLLNSIAEMNNITESHMSSTSVLPSPVSVLDSVFDKDESSSPSPVMKRSIDFKDLTVDLEDDIWSSVISPVLSAKDEDFISDDSDLTYISDIIRASKYLPDDSGVFLRLEKQQYLNGNDTSKVSKLQRKLVFDIVAEIVDRNRQLPPWNAISFNECTNSVNHICSEFQKIREREPADNLLDLICGVLKRDLAGNNGWGDHPVEMSEAVLYIERLIFKDLVSETILDLADFAGKSRFLAPRRKLVF
ncbi:protein LONGIFOLIA 1 [Cynara cardunculus var. scolymus]|uniref:DUF4378 domain-containing protein n=1 Tax=Cynara cardunculus var. scolymus TaxID=59895 RepID=A0A103Y7E5_CYNCS|nr:protein LONGIFOLIA 1 [Cynara cardunculus var. scolymus]KVI03897.1 protein of unknown function DUF4378 [Cynara cardunculus var. scolymus]